MDNRYMNELLTEIEGGGPLEIQRLLGNLLSNSRLINRVVNDRNENEEIYANISSVNNDLGEPSNKKQL